MSRLLLTCLVIVSLAMLVSAAVADVITVNGLDNEWGPLSPSGVVWSPDNGGIAESLIPLPYNININASYLGQAGALKPGSPGDPMFYFLAKQWAPFPTPPDTNSFMDLVLATGGPGVPAGKEATYSDGIPGADYLITFQQPTVIGQPGVLLAADLYKWTPALNSGNGNWLYQVSTQIPFAWSNNPSSGTASYWSVEWAVDPSVIWGKGTVKNLMWGAYLDNGTPPPDDACPNVGTDKTNVPEPGTLALMGLGLLGLVAWRRRKPAE